MDNKTLPLRLARWELGGIACVVLGMLAVLISLAARTGVTVDEPSHLLSAKLYWQGQDNLQPSDMPPLIKITGGWVPMLLDLPLPDRSHPSWKNGHEWDLALAMMSNLTGPQIRTIFFWSRLTLFVFPIGCALLLWWWGRQLFSPAIGLLIAVAFALSPTALGHGALFKNDLAAAFGYLLFWYRAWVYWRRPDLKSGGWLAAALLLAICAKFSMLILAPLAALLLVARRVTLPAIAWKGLAAEFGLTALILVAGINLAWQWQAPPLTAAEVQSWRSDPGIPKTLSRLVQVGSAVPMPPRFWRGAVSLVYSNSSMGPAYFLGQLRPGGDPRYFVTALALKLRSSALALILAGLVMCLLDFYRRRLAWHDLLWLGPPFLYILLASFSSLQLGVRLVIPALPFLFLIAGRALSWRGVWELGPAIPIILVCWLATPTLMSYPHYISFFNRWAGGPDNGLNYLSDSNIDWGQDLPELAKIIKERQLEPVRVAYFGTDNPWAYINDSAIEMIPPPWNDELAKGERQLRPKRGFYAISATLLTGQFFAEKYRDYFADFRSRRPFAKAGYSIYIYRVR